MSSSSIDRLESGLPLPSGATRLRDFGAAERRVIGDWLARLGLRWRFRAVVLAFGLPFLGFVLWTGTEQAATEKAHVHDRARARAALLAVRLEDFANEVDRLLASAALTVGPQLGPQAGPQIGAQSGPRVAAKPVDPAALAASLQSMRGYLPHAIYNIGVWSVDGVNLASLERRPGIGVVNVSDRAYFRDALRTRGLAIEGPLVSRTTGDAILQFARAVLDADGRAVAVLSMSCRLDALVGQIDDGGRISDGALVTVVDRDAVVIARSIDAAYWIGKRAPDSSRVAAAFEQRQGASEQAGADGVMRLSGFAAANHLPWLVVVGEPIEKAIAPVGQRLLRVIGVGIVIFCIALLIAGWTASWTLRPLLRLAADTERLAHGDLGHRSAVSSGGEIASLAQDFNRMAESLQERDRALATSQLRLRAIADNMPAQITYIDRDERYRFVNAYRGSLAVPPGEAVLGRTVRDLRGPTLYAVLAPYLHGALAGVPCTFEGSDAASSDPRHFRCTYVPERGPDGQVEGVYAFVHDITDSKRAALERIESERRLVTITDNLPALISYIDDTRRFRFANRVHERWFGRPLSDVLGRTFDDVLDPAVARQIAPYFLRGLDGETCEYEIEVPQAGRRPRWLRCTFIPDRADGAAPVRGVYGMIHDISETKAAEARLMHIARIDTLTGLANRRRFDEMLERALERPAEPQAGRLGLMFLDIDRFKDVNDRHGHATGDALLAAFARRLSNGLRADDTPARLSGDEFVVLLDGLSDAGDVERIACDLLAALREPFVVEGRRLVVSASIGVVLREDGDSPSMLMRRADEALYAAKHAGRDTVRIAA